MCCEKVCEKMKFAFITVKYNSKRDVENRDFKFEVQNENMPKPFSF